jgi:cell division protease FtsH
MLMALDAWLPIGFKLPDGAKVRTALFEGADWQIYETMGVAALVVVVRHAGARIGRMRG